MMEQGKVTGLELDPELLEIARRTTHEMGLEGVVEFLPAEKQRIPLPDASIHALVSEFIVYPTSTPTEISQVEMARVLRPGGKIVLTDVIVTRHLGQDVREALQSIGLDYLCEATQADFRSWMAEAGLVNLQLLDLTPTLRNVWEYRRSSDRVSAHRAGYATLLDDPHVGLGRAIFYLYLSGEKPKTGG
jgi:ubiquinone/menaquinone biosynthesis C-methylase UbiE